MKKAFISAATLAAALCHPAARTAEEETQVFLAGGELNYVGKLSADANARLFALFQSQETKPTILSIRSPGGNTDLGMELGKWVHQNHLDVKVMEVCFSSCANYVFPAARRKIVSNFAVVGYHGGLGSTTFQVDAATEAMLAALPAGEQTRTRASILESGRQYAASQLAREQKFFAMIGVQQKITTLGQAEKYAGTMPENALGWYYSVDDFEKLGVGNITVINPPWQPRFITAPFTVVRVAVE